MTYAPPNPTMYSWCSKELFYTEDKDNSGKAGGEKMPNAPKTQEHHKTVKEPLLQLKRSDFCLDQEYLFDSRDIRTLSVV